MAHTEQSCDFVLVPCDFAHLGCKALVQRNRLHEHYASNVHQHMAMMASKIASQTTTISELSTKIDSQAAKITELTERQTIRLEWTTQKGPLMRELLKGENIFFRSEQVPICYELIHLEVYHDIDEDVVYVCQETSRGELEGLLEIEFEIRSMTGTVLLSASKILWSDDEQDQDQDDTAITANYWLDLGRLADFQQLTRSLSDGDLLVIRWKAVRRINAAHSVTTHWHHLGNDSDGRDEQVSRLNELEDRVDELVDERTNKRRRRQ